ncbi:L,D-transpeptidase family protein [Geobacter argillaceus]|uniref:L,D-transpeptidase ErfK/SrfK n=1 Tax=Geobacter argillaceus TaxID=345631 RepID=A0A562VFH1_9BACT|nr:L,D-transpeptidase family protein [Geobacter argillaceus]TWJ16551.1 L,D-transpeptidase ErfK/SrfK [Geobacter argillaceus]
MDLSYLLRTTILLLFWFICQPQQCAAGAELFFRQGAGGAIGFHTIGADDSLVELARHYDVGFNEITAANPDVDPYIPEVGTTVTIPGRWILPDVPLRKGIVINVAEMRLYYFTPRTRGVIDTFPVGIGDEGWETPVGTYRIVEKMASPAWHVPASIRAQKPELPEIVPPGSDNPLGSHALRLSIGTVLIHGTDRPFGIGRRVSHGCIHLYPEDIVTLFRKVKLGDRVAIVRQRVKAAAVDGRVLVEFHDDGGNGLEQEAISLLERKGLIARVDSDQLKAAMTRKSGMPEDVTKK